ncbi:hypothetical protein ACFY3J_04505 [Streptomyces sp. NPDC001231]|uniref:hypothetical protein n=1 Tax=Streptomyces sp. NPDC001231 TaxID=3364549 RepID=UPI00369AE1D5
MLADNPCSGVQEPECGREKVVIASRTYVKVAPTVADDDLGLEIAWRGSVCAMVRPGRGTSTTVERLTQIYAEKQRTEPSARRELGRRTVAEYAKQWRPRRRRMIEYSAARHVDSSIKARCLGELEANGVGRGNQVNIFHVLKAVLRDGYGRGPWRMTL